MALDSLSMSRDAVPDWHTQNTIYRDSDGTRIATVFDNDYGNLFIAAPEMLAMLQEAEMVIRFAAQESAGRVKAEIVGGWSHHANKIRAAIARATGNA